MSTTSTNTTFFSNKEQYQEFKKAWSIAVNAPGAKSRLEPCDEYRYDLPNGTILEGWEKPTPSGGVWIRKGTGRYRVSGWIEAEHHMMYNIMRGKPLHTGFSQLVSARKINTYENPWHNFYDTVRRLRNRVRTAKMLVRDDALSRFYDKPAGFMNKVLSLTGKKKQKIGALERWKRENYLEKMQEFLAPFGNKITYEMLAKIDEGNLTLVLGFDRQNKPNYLF